MPKSFLLALLNMMILAPVIHAQTEAAGPEIRNLRDVLAAGGLPLWVIVALSVIALFLVIFFLFTFRAAILYPKSFLREAEDAAEEGDLEALRAVCTANPSAAARIVAAATEQISGSGRADYIAVRDAVEDEGSRQASVLWQRLQYLMDVAVISPMVGLLGTVLGMLDSFANLQAEVGTVRPLTISQGVAKALITTAGGLVVGIVAMVLYALFRGRVHQLVAGLEESCSLILRRFTGNFKPENDA